MDFDQQIYTVSSLYLILAVIGLVANPLQLRQMWIKKQHRSNCGKLFFSLAITDFLTALMFIILGIGILLFFPNEKILYQKSGNSYDPGYNFNAYILLASHHCNCKYRLYCVLFPLKHLASNNKRREYIMIAGTWIASAFITCASLALKTVNILA